MTREKFLTENAEEIRRLKAKYLPEIVSRRGQIIGVISLPGVPDNTRQSAHEIIQRSQPFEFFEHYQGFVKHKSGAWYHLAHSPKPPYNAEKFTADVEYLVAESEHAEQTAPPKTALKPILIGIAAGVVTAVIGTVLTRCLPE